MRLDRARARMTAYMTAHGGRATITRKTGEAWAPVATDVPCIVETGAPGPQGIDPGNATPDSGQVPKLTFPHGTDIRRGDRVDVTAPEGHAPETLTIGALAHSTLDTARVAYAMAEETAVESWTVTIERWNDATGTYDTVLEASAQAVTRDVGERTSDTRGATGTAREGTLIFSPVPTATIGVGDWIRGLPWAASAQTTRVRPVVGNRLEVDYRYTA